MDCDAKPSEKTDRFLKNWKKIGLLVCVSVDGMI